MVEYKDFKIININITSTRKQIRISGIRINTTLIISCDDEMRTDTEGQDIPFATFIRTTED